MAVGSRPTIYEDAGLIASFGRERARSYGQCLSMGLHVDRLRSHVVKYLAEPLPALRRLPFWLRQRHAGIAVAGIAGAEEALSQRLCADGGEAVQLPPALFQVFNS